MKGWTLAVLKFWSQWVKIKLKFVLFITIFTEQEMEQNRTTDSILLCLQNPNISINSPLSPL